MNVLDMKFFGAMATASLIASTALAAGNTPYSTIDTLPDEGRVSLQGMVSEVSDEDSFILRDTAGNTIDVHTASAIDLNVGENVTVTGEVEDDAMGMGQEIADATITNQRSNPGGVSNTPEVNDRMNRSAIPNSEGIDLNQRENMPGTDLNADPGSDMTVTD